MKKSKYLLSLVAVGMLLAACGTATVGSSTAGDDTPTSSQAEANSSSKAGSSSKSSAHKHTWDDGKAVEGDINGCGAKTYEYKCTDCGETKREDKPAQLHEMSFMDHKGLIDLESCDNCQTKAYKFPIKYAAGFNDPNTKMNARSGDSSKSTWNIEGQLAPGKYEVEITTKLSQSSSTDRHWYNHAKAGEETATSNPDTNSESDFRYWVEVDSQAFYPTSKKTWGEEGLNSTDYKRTVFIAEVEVKSTTKTINFVHGNIGYSLLIDNIRLIAKSGTNVPNKLPAAPEGVFDPEGNTGGDTGGGVVSGDPVDVSNVPNVGLTPGGEGDAVYGKSVTKKISVPASSVEAIALTSNNTGAEVSVLHDGVQQYVDAMYAAEAKENLTEETKYKMRDKACGSVSPVTYQGKYYENGVQKNNEAGNMDYFGDSDRDNFKNVVLTWDTDKGDATSFYVEVGMKADLSDAKVVQTTAKKIELGNLYVSKTYYWRVTDSNGRYHSAIGSFVTKGSFRNINAGAAYNVRDIGGWKTTDGKTVKYELLYRGNMLNGRNGGPTLTEEGIKVFVDELGIKIWSIHLPYSDLKEGNVGDGGAFAFCSTSESVRQSAVNRTKVIMTHLAVLSPKYMLIHPHNDVTTKFNSYSGILAWKTYYKDQGVLSYKALVSHAASITCPDGSHPVLIIENVGNTGTTSESLTANVNNLKWFCEQVPGLGVCLDTSHALVNNCNSVGNDPSTLITSLGSLLKHIHIHGGNPANDKDLHVMPGYKPGTLDLSVYGWDVTDAIQWGKFYKTLIDKGYRGTFCYEYTSPEYNGDFRDCIANFHNIYHNYFDLIIPAYKKQ